MPEPIRISEFRSVGCLTQGVGLATPFVLFGIAGVPGAIGGGVLAVALFTLGAYKRLRYLCARCRYPLAGKSTQLCPLCNLRMDCAETRHSGVPAAALYSPQVVQPDPSQSGHARLN